MARTRRRRSRLVAALTAAVLLAGALAWTTFSAASDTVTAGTLARGGRAGRSYELTGRVVAGYHRDGDLLSFRVRDRTGRASVAVRYRGAVPDPFRTGREVVVTVRRGPSGWIGERDSLVTKCPSKFSASQAAQ